MDSGILRNRSTLLAAASILALGSHAAPAFAQAQDATDTGQQASDPGGNVIVVTGFRASLEDALEAKRESNLIIESVTAEDIGKFPDQNVAESHSACPASRSTARTARVRRSAFAGSNRTSRCSTASSSSAGSKSTRSAKAITIATTASKACRPN